MDPSLCEHIKTLDIEKPLEIQSLAIPKILHGHNTLIAAETGCGKTLAYVLPLITQVLRWKEMEQRGMNCPLGLIVTPSRELAVQIGVCNHSLILNICSYTSNILTKRVLFRSTS